MATDESLVKRRIKQFSQKDADEEPDVDVFDFKRYSKDFQLFSKHFQGVELYLRTAIWIGYKYNYITTTKDRKELDRDASSAKGQKQYLEKLSDVFETRDLLEAWYNHFNPDKVDEVDNLIQKYVFCEDELFNRLYQKYVDKNWVSITLWFHDKRCDKRMKAGKPVAEKKSRGPRKTAKDLPRKPEPSESESSDSDSPSPPRPRKSPERRSMDSGSDSGKDVPEPIPRRSEQRVRTDGDATISQTRARLEDISQQLAYYKSLIVARKAESAEITERRDEVFDEAIDKTSELRGPGRTQAIAKYISENMPIELMSQQQAKEYRDLLREKLQKQLEDDAKKRELERNLVETGLKRPRRVEKAQKKREVKRSELLKTISDLTAHADEKRFGSITYAKTIIKALTTQRDILKNQLALLEGLTIDVRRDEGVQRLVKKVLKGIRASRQRDQYYNIATDSAVAAGKRDLFYNSEYMLAHTDKQELRLVARLLSETLVKPELAIPEGVTFTTKSAKTGEHEYATIPVELYNKYKDSSDVQVSKPKSLRVTNPKYKKFIKNYNAQYQPTNVISEADIQAALQRLKVVRPIEEEGGFVPSHKIDKSISIVMTDFPAIIVDDVMVATPYGKMSTTNIDISESIVYNTYALEDSEEDQRLKNNTSAEFLGRYNKLTNGSYVREDLIQQRDHLATFETSGQGSFDIYARLKSNGRYVYVNPDFYDQIKTPGSPWILAHFNGTDVLYDEQRSIIVDLNSREMFHVEPENIRYVYEDTFYVKVSGVDYFVPVYSEEYNDILHSGRQDIQMTTTADPQPAIYHKYRVEKMRGDTIEYQPRRQKIKGFSGFTA